MKKYKINNYIIDAESPVKAMQIAKMLNDNLKDAYPLRYIGQLLGPLAAKYNAKLSYYIDNNGYAQAVFGTKEPKDVRHATDMFPGLHAEMDAKGWRFSGWDRNYVRYEYLQRNAFTKDSVKDSLDQSELEVVEDAIYWVKKSGKSLTINNILEQINKDMKGFLGSNQSHVIEYLKNEKHIKDSIKDAKMTPEKMIQIITPIVRDFAKKKGVEDYWKIHQNGKNVSVGIELSYRSLDELCDIINRKLAPITESYFEPADAGLIETTIFDSIKDEDITYLSKEEEKAIEDYKRAIANTKDPKLLKLFAHILKEETEHLEELQTETVEDSVKDGDAWLDVIKLRLAKTTNPEEIKYTSLRTIRINYANESQAKEALNIAKEFIKSQGLNQKFSIYTNGFGELIVER